MGVQLSLKAALPLSERLATASDRCMRLHELRWRRGLECTGWLQIFTNVYIKHLSHICEALYAILSELSVLPELSVLQALYKEAPQSHCKERVNDTRNQELFSCYNDDRGGSSGLITCQESSKVISPCCPRLCHGQVILLSHTSE